MAISAVFAFIKKYSVFIGCVGSFICGVYLSHLYYDREIQIFKNEQLSQIIQSHKNEVQAYEESIEILRRDLSTARATNDERLRQLSAYKQRVSESESKARDCSAVLGLAIEGEQLLAEADGFIKALMRQK